MSDHRLPPGPLDRDPAVRRHRAHQAEWRERVLDRSPGPPTDSRARERYPLLASCLAEEHGGTPVADEGLNIMSASAREYTRDRLKQLKEIDGVAEPDRLWRNLLSSQPLAFSIAGELRARREAAASVLAALTRRPVTGFAEYTDEAHGLDGIEAEWFPPREVHTGDQSGFDMASLMRVEGEGRLFLSIEVKYVDTFSRAKLDYDRYREHLEAVGLDRNATEALVAVGASQFLRSVLLTESVRRHGVRGNDGVNHALAVVLGRGDDKRARRVVEALAEHDMPTRVAYWSHEQFLDAAAAQPELSEWAAAMRQRYVI